MEFEYFGKIESEKKTVKEKPFIGLDTPEGDILQDLKNKQKKADMYLFVLQIVIAVFVVVSIVGIIGTIDYVFRRSIMVKDYPFPDYKKIVSEFRVDEAEALSLTRASTIASSVYGVEEKILTTLLRCSGYKMNFADKAAGLFGPCMINPVILNVSRKEAESIQGVYAAARFLSIGIKQRGLKETIYVYMNYSQKNISNFFAEYKR